MRARRENLIIRVYQLLFTLAAFVAISMRTALAQAVTYSVEFVYPAQNDESVVAQIASDNLNESIKLERGRASLMLPSGSYVVTVIANKAPSYTFKIVVRTSALSVDLESKKALEQIGLVHVAANRPLGRSSLQDLLDGHGEVTINDLQQGTGPQVISVRGANASLTDIKIDNITVGFPGLAVDLRNLGVANLRASLVSANAGTSAVGGSVNFQTVDFSDKPFLQLDDTYGTITQNYAETGGFKSGHFAVVAAHAISQTISTITGKSYLDASGLDYSHGGNDQSLNDYAKLLAVCSD